MIHSATATRSQWRRPQLGHLADTTTQIVGASGQTAAAALATVQAASSAGLITLSTTLAAAIPVAGAVVALGLVAFNLLHDSRAAQQKVETTNVVNRAEAVMKANLAAWNGSAKSFATQAACVKVFNDAWAAIENFCSQASEGNPGKRCVSERQRGGQYDYFANYLDPIAKDPHAGDVDRAAEAVAAADPLGALLGKTTTGGTNWTAYALPAALLVAALFIGDNE